MKNQKVVDLLDSILDQVDDKETLLDIQDQLFKRGVETLLKSELKAHLGYEKGEKPISSNTRNGHSQKTLKTNKGDVLIKVPRDRDSSFNPVTVPKHETITDTIYDTVILLYAKGMSNSDIVDFIEQTYGVKYSTSQVSIITNTLMEDIEQWQSRPLQDQYAMVWIDGIHYKIRQDGKVISKAAMIVLGVDMQGMQDILSIDVVENESASAWMGMLKDLTMRGVEDILFLCSDNLTGLDKAVEAVFPKSTRQVCIVHQIRNSLKFVSYKDKQAVMKDIRAIYQADNQEQARKALMAFKENWQGKYDKAINSWEENWDNLTAFLEYPPAIRKLIYTTNIIENFNSVLRKYTRNKKVFPNDQSAIKSIYLAAQQIRSKWQRSRAGWNQVYNQLYICFEDRVK
ncbi:MAG TPA: IS256 family transposase [Dysgonamonadaceae bacterium]|nr:IS256 family transposase [Dysgonamonadaceae bacterium]